MMWKDLITWNRKKGEQSAPQENRVDHPLITLHERMNTLFDNFFNDFGIPSTSSIFPKEWGHHFSPKINVSENDKAIEITAELPGMDEKNISVTLDKNILTIKGEKKQDKEEKSREYYHVERSYGVFQRSLKLSCDVEFDKIKASFKKGVLNINLPKSPEAKEHVKHIEVKGE